jgi:beta-aspartyl-peptidase (threonine type)
MSSHNENKKIAIAVHGGAGTIRREEMTDEKEAAYKNGLRAALMRGWEILQARGSALDAVEAAVRALEDDALFNAGRGSVFTNEGRHEMDAAIMSGADKRAGAVACVRNIKNPVTLARRVMERTRHVLLCGEGAEKFARETGVEFAPADYFFSAYRHQQLLDAQRADRVQLDHSTNRKIGTVGAVARDAGGNLAAATSTGGMTNKRFGRIGDTPLIGAGTYADNAVCAVSCTGDGEFFIRAVAAYDLACLMKYKGMKLDEAASQVIGETLPAIGGEGGLIAIDAKGNLSLRFNSEGMYRAWITTGGEVSIKIYEE